MGERERQREGERQIKTERETHREKTLHICVFTPKGEDKEGRTNEEVEWKYPKFAKTQDTNLTDKSCQINHEQDNLKEYDVIVNFWKHKTEKNIENSRENVFYRKQSDSEPSSENMEARSKTQGVYQVPIKYQQRRTVMS